MGSGRVLLIHSDAARRSAVEEPLRAAGYAVETIAHESAVAHISRSDMSAYDAVVVALGDEPSTLSSMFRMGEYVLHFIGQLCPAVLPRVIVLMPVTYDGTGVPAECAAVQEPVSPKELLAAIGRR